MKKFLSMFLALAMLLSMTVLPVSALIEEVGPTEAGGNWNGGTLVSYDAEDPDGDGIKDNTEAYTVTVPAQLAPGTGGEVVLAGTWASDRKVIVTADEEVILENSINPSNTKTLDVTFETIEQIGDNEFAIEVKEDVSVADIEKAIFGTWSGTFNYNVSISTIELNAIKFYQPYKFIFDETNSMEIVFHEDGAVDIYHTVDGFEYGEVYNPGFAIYEKGTVTLFEDTLNISEDGTILTLEGELTGVLVPTQVSPMQMNAVYEHCEQNGWIYTLVFYQDGSARYVEYNSGEIAYEEIRTANTFKYCDKYFTEDWYYKDGTIETYRYAIYPDGSKVIIWGEVYTLTCDHLNTELRDAASDYSGDSYCLDCGMLLERGKYNDSHYLIDEYALILDNSGDVENKNPMIFIRSSEEIEVGDTYNSRTFGELPVIAVYTNFESTPADYDKFPEAQWGENSRMVTSVVFEHGIKPLTTAAWFNEFTICESYNLTNLDTSNVTDMTQMFMYCGTGLDGNIVQGNLTALDTSNVISMYYMFDSSHFEHLDLSSFDTKKVTDMCGMFYYAKTQKVTYGPNWDTSNVLDMTHMYQSSWVEPCLQNFNLSKADTAYMFRTNYSITSITIPKTIQYIGEQMFYSCANLQTIYYEGTINEWHSLRKDQQWNYKVPATQQIICSDGVASGK